MIKLGFKKKNETPASRLEVYSNITRIPFSLNLESLDFGKGIYTRYLVDDVFIEFWFSESAKKLKNVTLVSTNEKQIIASNLDSDLGRLIENSIFYDCFLSENDKHIVDKPFIITKGCNYIILEFSLLDSVEYYKVTKELVLGVNNNSELVSIILFNLSLQNIDDILGT